METVQWDSKKKQVVHTMSWEEARDYGHWLQEEHNDPLGDLLVEAAKKGAGF